ncbi:MAG: O-antigen ligase family protein [Patescibacteria group bacterium]|nr:MAG: O-antigen ligase family protein [Patescibacteria group bacterium]
MTPFLPVVFAAFAALAWHDLRKAFLLFVAALPVYIIRFPVAGIPTTALEVLFVILFAAWMFKREKRLIDIKGWGWLLLAWLIVATVSLFVSPDFRAAAGVWKAYFIEPILFFLIANDLMRAQKDRDAVVGALACSALAVSGMAIAQHWTGWGVPPPFNGVPVPPATEAEFRSTSFYGFPNAVGLFLAPLAPFFLRKKPLHLAAFFASVAAIALAQSEGALIGLAAGVGVYLLCFKKTRLPAVLAGAVAVVALLLLPTRALVIEKLTLNDWSGRVRKEMWVEASQMLKDHAVLGAGLSGYPIVFDTYHKARHIEIFQYPHQLVLNFWSELGLAGVIAFFLLIGRYFQTAGRLLRDNPVWAAMLIASMTALLVHGLVDVPYFKNDLSMLFWLLLAFASSALAEARRVDAQSKN